MERQQQQAARRGRPTPAPTTSAQKGVADASTHDSELDILDTLNLGEAPPVVRLKELLLSTDANGKVDPIPSAKADDAEGLRPLADLLQTRIDEGFGETLFDVGLEDSGESMALSREQWDVALERLRKAAGTLKADVRVLMTRNVGGSEEVGPMNEKDKSVSGKVIMRRKPETTQDAIETRIAVVGNGERPRPQQPKQGGTDASGSGRGQEYHAGRACQGQPR